MGKTVEYFVNGWHFVKLILFSSFWNRLILSVSDIIQPLVMVHFALTLALICSVMLLIQTEIVEYTKNIVLSPKPNFFRILVPAWEQPIGAFVHICYLCVLCIWYSVLSLRILWTNKQSIQWSRQFDWSIKLVWISI